MEQKQATAPFSDEPAALVDVEQAEAAIVEHYPRLVRLGYLILPSGMGRGRRVLAAHALTQRALPHNRASGVEFDPGLPGQRASGEAGDPPDDAGYAFVRLRVVRTALRAARPPRRWRPGRRGQLTPLLPHVWGLRLFPRSGGADELALDQALAALSGPGRAAYVLRGLERLRDDEVRAVLKQAGVTDTRAALTEADGVRGPAGSRDGALLESAEFDACSLQARPPDLMRRRQHFRAAAASAAAIVVCGTLLGMPGDGWGGGTDRGRAAAPPYAANPAAEAALNPAKLTHASHTAWRRATRADFAMWPTRGDRTRDKELLGRALAAWARPGDSVQVSATPGTQVGPPPGPPQLLFAGDVDQTAVVLLFDGLRVVRYAEANDGGAAALDFARADAADAASSTALVVGREDGNVRYLTAPWVRRASERDLLRPDEAARPLPRTEDGVTEPVRSPAQVRDCRAWTALQLDKQLVTDLGELTPVRLTYGAPGSARRDVAGKAARTSWAHTACQLPLVHARGVRAVNSWRFAAQPLPEDGGKAAWVCTRAETWRGAGSRVLAQFQAPPTEPDEGPGTPGAIAASADDSPACGKREPRVLAGVLWKSAADHWYVLAAGSRPVASIEAQGAVHGTATGRLLALPAKQGDRADLNARLTDGSRLDPLG